MLFLFLFQCLSFAHVFPVSQNNGLIRPKLCLSNLQRLCANSELVLPFGVPPEAFMCLHFELCHVVVSVPLRLIKLCLLCVILGLSFIQDCNCLFLSFMC